MSDIQTALDELKTMARRTRVFLSMPYVPGVTPNCLDHAKNHNLPEEMANGIERREGIFSMNEAGLSPVDHGNLYGDAVYEGIKIVNARVVLLKEHLERWFNSANEIGLRFPYTRRELVRIILEISKQSLGEHETTGYLRPVLTRGLGNLGVHYNKCIGPSLYIIASCVSFYPAQLYQQGLAIAIARKMRRNDPAHLNPNTKTNNYLNNILALRETEPRGVLETMMLTNEGYVAEATGDNLFVAQMIDGEPTLSYPAAKYALVGLTRNTIIQVARELGFKTIERDDMLPTDFIGPNREVFLTGTAAGLMPIQSVDGLLTADAQHRPLTQRLQSAVERRMAEDPDIAISVDASDEEIDQYLAKPFAVDLNVN